MRSGRRFALALAALVSGCASSGDQTFTIYSGQSPETLAALVDAAHACGLSDVKIDSMSHLEPGVVIPESALVPSPYSCTMDWVRAHPETGLKVPA